ncbi:tail assembly protein [Salmonella enterica subsp. enterica serovar Java]|uniref:Tail assembly protein n=1 Tax=Salmonella enterica subsp. enterica serovar Java TaxID=224729 RepID=A0A3Y9C3L7_SALEB|nr:tail assembly protein [Salmonella enterica subsp. enterica serovar Java]ELE9458271.1 tail assembly protein [Salmonella enterica]HCM8924214.1 tail assembly protein [Salmonella enterica subsp. enterica serovar Paratyphi B]ECG3198889.1 tail assembly protein [Salmonella enterica subsp. enterica serovar Java]EDC4057587.1 tail assembly protein [Salmonella enterica subsp. enterica serovar Java]
MAAQNALTMATPTMARVCLYGDLQRFGKRFSLSIKTAAEGVYALSMQIPGFRQRMSEGWYQVRIAGRDVAPDDVTARLHEPLPTGAVIHIVPRMGGAKSGGVFQVVLGAVAIGAAFFTGGASMAAWGALSTGLFTAGASMMLGGVAQMLAPQPKAPSMHNADNGKQNTYFSSLDNMVAQGNPLPVAYGEVMSGSRRISQELSTRDESSPDKVVHFGRKGFMGAPGLTGKLEDKTNAILAAQGITKPRVVIR